MSVVASVSAHSTNTTSVTSGAIDTTTANTILAYVHDYEVGTLGTFSDSKSNTWVNDGQVVLTGSARTTLFRCVNGIVGTGHTFTYDSGASLTNAAIIVVAFTEEATVPLEDTNEASSSSVSTLQTGSITPDDVDRLLVIGFGLGGLAGNPAASPSFDNSFGIEEFEEPIFGVAFGGGLAWKISGSTSSINPQITVADARDIALIITSYQVTGGGGGDVTAPTMTSRSVPISGKVVDGTYDENVSGVAVADYELIVDGLHKGLSSVTGSGTIRKFGIGKRYILPGQTVTMNYIGTGTVDTSSNVMATFSAVAVTNNSEVTERGIRHVSRKKGLFIVWGMSTFHNVEHCNGSEDPDTFIIPTDFGACVDNWIAHARLMGADYIVFLTKHHDGFCHWVSDENTHNISASSSWIAGGSPDFVQIFCEKVRVAGLGVGLYYSIWDKRWESDNGGGSPSTYTAHVQAELTELLSRYGTIDLIWFDGWNWIDVVGDFPDYTEVNYDDIMDTINTYHPDLTIINNSHEDPEDQLAKFHVVEYEAGIVGASVPSDNEYVAEQCISILGGQWFWDDTPPAPDSIATILAKVAEVNGRNATILIDAPPDDTGMIPFEYSKISAAIGIADVLPSVNPHLDDLLPEEVWTYGDRQLT